MSRVVAPRDEVAPFASKWERRAEDLIGTRLAGRDLEAALKELYEVAFGVSASRSDVVDSPGAAARLINTGAMGGVRLCNDGWATPAVPNGVVGDGRFAFDTSFVVWTALVREQSSIYSTSEDRMRWSVGLRFGVLDDWYPVYDWLSRAHPDVVTRRQRTLLSVGWHLGWYWTFEDRVLVCQPPVDVVRDGGLRRVMFRDGWVAA